MSVDFNRIIRSVVDLGSESYEQRLTKMIVKAAMVVLFLIVVWRFLK